MSIADLALEIENTVIDVKNIGSDALDYLRGSESELSSILNDWDKFVIDMTSLVNDLKSGSEVAAKFLTVSGIATDLIDIHLKSVALAKTPDESERADLLGGISDVFDIVGSVASLAPPLEEAAFSLKFIAWGFGLWSSALGSVPTNTNNNKTPPASQDIQPATDAPSIAPVPGVTLGSGTITQPDGTQDNYQSGTNGLLSGDSWTAADQMSGMDTFNTDGSSTSKITYANGAYATVVNDGRGNITTDYFTQNGIEIRSTWVHSDGSSGSVTEYGDGLANNGSASGFSVPQSASFITENPDGSYSSVSGNDKSEVVTITHDANGNPTGQSNQSATATNDLAVNHSSLPSYIASEGIVNTNDYNAEGGWIGGSWYSANSDGSANPAGVYEAWAQVNATKGTLVINASGVDVWEITAVDGSTWRDTAELQGDTVSRLDVSNELLSDKWHDTDGVTGTDTFSGSSGTGTFSNSDGSGGNVSLDTQGNITITNTNAQGKTVSTDVWNAANGSYDITLFNADGSKDSDDNYLANGNVVVADYAADGSVADQETEAAGLMIDPDGSSFGKVVNADGSYTVYYENASGDTTAWVYSGGRLTDTYHTTSNDTEHAAWAGTFSNGTPWTSNDNSNTLNYTDAQGTQWTIYTDAKGNETGGDFVTLYGTHGYVTFNSDGSFEQETYNPDGSLQTYFKDAAGNIFQEFFDSNGNETNDTWNNVDGSSGWDRYWLSGFSEGESINADRSYSSYSDDGQGNRKTTYYNTQGVPTSDNWTATDGSYGTDTFNADGTSSGTATNADGSYSTYTNDGLNNIFTLIYGSAGNKIGDSWKKSDGSSGADTYNADGSSSGITTNVDGSFNTYSNDGQGNVVTDAYASNGMLKSQTGGIPSLTVMASDGSYTTALDDGKGNTTTFEYNADGVKIGDTWTKSDDSAGSDIYNADGSSVNSSYNPNTGITDYKTTDASGNWADYKTSTDASGTYLQTWTASDGTSGETERWTNGDTLSEKTNADGSWSQTTYDASTDITDNKITDASGNWTDYQTSIDMNATYLETSTASDGTSSETELFANDDTLSEQTNADGSSNETTYDASTGITEYKTTDASGNWTDYKTSTDANGTYLQTWTASDGTSGETEKWVTGSTLSEQTNADGSSVETIYDALTGTTVDTTTNAEGVSQSETTLGEATYQVIQNPDGSTTQTTVSTDGLRTVATTDILGNIETQYYDPTGTLLGSSETSNDNEETTSFFDASGNLIGYSNSGGEWGTDVEGNVLGEKTASTSYRTVTPSTNGTEIYSYDAGSGVTIDQWQYSNGSTSTTLTTPDGSNDVVTNDGQGDSTSTRHSEMSGVIDAVWTNSDSSHGNDVTQSDGSGTSTSYHADGSYSVTTYGAYNTNNPYYHERDSQTDDYTASGLLTGSTITSYDDTTGRTQTNNYDANGTLLSDSWNDISGNVGSDIYNADGSSSVTIDSQTFNYDSAGNLVSTVTISYDSYGGSTATTTNAAGQVINDSWTKPDGSFGTDSYHPDGSGTGTTTYANGDYSTSTFDAAGNRTTDNYTAAGILTGYSQSSTDPTTGNITTENYTVDGQLNGSSATTIDNTMGRLQTDIYDANGRLLSDIWRDTSGDAGSDTYNADGSYTSILIDSSDDQTTSYYDVNGNLTSSTEIDWQGNSTITNYGPMGVVTSEQWSKTDGSYGTTTDNADGSTNSVTYQANGSYVTTLTNSDGSMQTSSYSASNALISHTVTDSSGDSQTTNYSYSATGAVSGTDTTTYNPDGSYVVASTDALGNTTTDSYDANGVLWKHEKPDGSYTETIKTGSLSWNGWDTYYGTVTNAYDTNGRLVEEEAVLSMGDGILDHSLTTYAADGSFTETNIAEDESGTIWNATSTQFNVATNTYQASGFDWNDGDVEEVSPSIQNQEVQLAADGTQTYIARTYYDDGSLAELFTQVKAPSDSTVSNVVFTDIEYNDGGGYGILGPVASTQTYSEEGGQYGFIGGATTSDIQNATNMLVGYDQSQGNTAAALAAQQAGTQATAIATASTNTSAQAVSEGAVWAQPVITWSLGNLTDSTNALPFSSAMTSADVPAIESAFNAWAQLMPGVTFDEVSAPASADIILGFADLNTANTGMLGYTSYQANQGAMQSATIEIEDPNETALVSDVNGQQVYAGSEATLTQVLEHEIGHALGFADNADPNSIMYYALSSNNAMLDAADIAGANQLYGSSNSFSSLQQMIQAMATFAPPVAAQSLPNATGNTAAADLLLAVHS